MGNLGPGHKLASKPKPAAAEEEVEVEEAAEARDIVTAAAEALQLKIYIEGPWPPAQSDPSRARARSRRGGPREPRVASGGLSWASAGSQSALHLEDPAQQNAGAPDRKPWSKVRTLRGEGWAGRRSGTAVRSRRGGGGLVAWATA